MEECNDENEPLLEIVVLSTPGYLHHLGRFIQSYLKQVGKEVHLTIVHTGGPPPIVEHGIDVVHRHILHGCGAAREIGRASTRADWTLYTDCDVSFPNTFMPALLNTLRSARDSKFDAVQLDFSPSNATVWGEFEFHFDKLTLLSRSEMNRGQEWWKGKRLDRISEDVDFLELTCMQGFGMLIRRDALIAIGGFDSRLNSGEDRDVAARLRKNGVRIGLSPRCFLYHSYDFSLIRIIRRKIWHGQFSALTSAKHPDEFSKSVLSCVRMMTIGQVLPPVHFRSLRGRIYFALQAVAFGCAHIFYSIPILWNHLLYKRASV